jgi:hypothetical protein
MFLFDHSSTAGIEFKRAAQMMHVTVHDVLLPYSTWQCPGDDYLPAVSALCNSKVISPFTADRMLKGACEEWSQVRPDEIWEKNWGKAFNLFYMQDNMCVLLSLTCVTCVITSFRTVPVDLFVKALQPYFPFVNVASSNSSLYAD